MSRPDRHEQRVAAQAATREHAHQARLELYKLLTGAVEDDTWRKHLAEQFIDWLLTDAHWRTPLVRPDAQPPPPAKRRPDPPSTPYRQARAQLRGREESE